MRGCSWIGPLLTLSLLSCAKAPDHPPVFPVRGQVLYEGKPAAGAVVILHSADNPTEASRPRGRANANGEFELTTYETSDGAPPGTYVVTVEWKRPSDHPEQGADLLPTIYGDPKTSRLRATVTAGINEPVVLRLTRTP